MRLLLCSTCVCIGIKNGTPTYEICRKIESFKFSVIDINLLLSPLALLGRDGGSGMELF